MAVFQLGGVHGEAALADVEEGDLAVVLPGAQQAGVLQVVADAGQRAAGPQLELRHVRVVQVPDVAGQRAPLLLALSPVTKRESKCLGYSD